MQLYKLFSSIETVHNPFPHFPPTLIYNEGWLLRLVMDWFAQHKSISHPLAFEDNAFWFSEALLPSTFAPRYRGDKLAEARTHLDGVIGHFAIGDKGKADFALLPTATQFMALEAKIYSKLSATVRNAPYYDQAARNVACISEVLRRANRLPQMVATLGFYVLAPQSQIGKGIFEQDLSKGSIRRKVEQRAQEYDGKYNTWCTEWFYPTLDCIRIEAISWESIVDEIAKSDPGSGSALQEFLNYCLQYSG